jgi:6-pyruvoyltetrahydropterin/6-carboxytetrahydropterin synthase
MVVDFSHLKAAMRDIVDPFDHRLLNEIPPFDQITSTAENLAEHIYSRVSSRLADDRVSVSRVDVWETDTSCASYEP